MLKYKVNRDPYDDGILFTGKLQREIKPGLTILVGCNGAGKTTVLHAIEGAYKNNSDYLIIYWNGLTDKHYTKDRALMTQRFDVLSSLMCSSEGEEININIGIVAQQIGNSVRNNEDKDIIILFDGLDSGLSIDNIIDTKDFFKNLVIPDVERSGHNCYVIISANEYELANGELCIDVRNGKEIRFSSYEDYKRFILDSKKKKDNRKPIHRKGED